MAAAGGAAALRRAGTFARSSSSGSGGSVPTRCRSNWLPLRSGTVSIAVFRAEPRRARPCRTWIRCRSSSSPGNGRGPPGNGRGPPAWAPRVGADWKTPAEEGRAEKFFATCAPGLEEVVAAELRAPAVGAARVEVGSAGVAFEGEKSVGVKASLWLRSATRVLLELATGPLPSRSASAKDPVYEFVRRAAHWPTLLVDSDAPRSVENAAGEVRKLEKNFSRSRKFRTFSVSSRVRDCDSVTNSLFASVRAKDAICDAVKDACGGARPSPPEEEGADVPLFLALYRGHAALYRDMSGVSLHKRGYRDVMHRAALNEAVAAAMLTVAGWNRWIPEFASSSEGENAGVLMDPMCGSGTLLIEAALMAVNSAPGLMRARWPFETWHDFHPSILSRCREEAIAAEVSAPRRLRLLGNDIHEGALSLCVRDAEAANVRSMIELSCRDCRNYSPPVSPSLVVVNPPWGARLDVSGGEEDDQALLGTWQALGRFLKAQCSRSDVYVLSGNSSVTHAMHMKAQKKWPVSVGGVNCRIMHYHVLPPKESVSHEAKIKLASA